MLQGIIENRVAMTNQPNLSNVIVLGAFLLSGTGLVVSVCWMRNFLRSLWKGSTFRMGRFCFFQIFFFLSLSFHELAQAELPGLTISRNSFTYDAPDGQVTGFIMMPSGPGPHPGVVISHGKGSSANGFAPPHASVMTSWGFVCIAPNFTHVGQANNEPDNEAYSPENSRRARRCLDILADLGSVDMSRVALFGNSMGGLLSAGLAGEIPSQIRAVCITAAGTSGTEDVDSPYPSTNEVAGITAPTLMFHGTADTTVLPETSAFLHDILEANSVPRKRLLFQGFGHVLLTDDSKRAEVHAIMKAWFTEHGLLASSGNSAPTLTVAADAVAIAGATTQIPLTIDDGELTPEQLIVEAISMDDSLLLDSHLEVVGSGNNRFLEVTISEGISGEVEVVLLLDDGELSTARFLQLSLQEEQVGSVNHRPSISWIGDLRSPPGASIPAIDVVVGDRETPDAELTLSVESSNFALLPVGNIAIGGVGRNRTLDLSPVSAQSGMTTITVTVSDGEKSSATAFTLTIVDEIDTPPSLQSIAEQTLVSGESFGPVSLVVQDTETSESALMMSAESSNSALVPVDNIVFGGQNYGRTLTVIPATGEVGRATITLKVDDGANVTSTAFLIEVISSNTAPTFVSLPSYHLMAKGSLDVAIPIEVADAETDNEDLYLTASSSNTALIPNEAISISGNGANRILTVSPASGMDGAATITLHLSDGDFLRSESVLCVVTDESSAAAQFSRPRGIYILDSGGPLNYTTTFGKDISLRDANIRDYPFIDGFTLRAGWDEMESGSTPGTYDFFIVQNALEKLPPDQKLSLIIVPTEPAYIAITSGVETWEDGALTRARPWDPILRTQRRAFLASLAAYEVGGIPLSEHPQLDLINPYLPGGFTGIRNPNGTPVRNIPGYSRELFLSAVQDELRALQEFFPGKFVQIGFWPIVDDENAAYDDLAAWEWLRQELVAEFDGVTRPRVGFFMENLAAKRSGPAVDPYTATPITPFAGALYASRDQTWTGFQMLGSWTRPFNDGHVGNTLNGSAADAMEWAFNAYRAEYHEVYISDVDSLAVQSELQGWHDFFASNATTAPNSDEDQDGLPLWWEELYETFPTINNALDDKDQDGLEDLLEFAFNTNPSEPTAGKVLGVSRKIDTNDGLEYLELTYPRRLDAPWLSYLIEVSSTLSSWSSGPAHIVELSNIPSQDGVSEAVTVRLLPAMTGATEPLFGRVFVTVEPN